MDGASRAAFEEWYRSLHPRLVTAIAAATGDPDVAADAADEACSRALERWAGVQAMTSPEAWAYTVGLNVARRRFRRRRRERELLWHEHGPGTIEGPAGELWAVVAGLPQRQREAVVLRHVGQLTEAEIAEVMGVKRGTVSSTLRAAYRTLRAGAADLEEVSDG
jgi:RNA polymerase sigma-70 factor (ECF subfamily)